MENPKDRNLMMTSKGLPSRSANTLPAEVEKRCQMTLSKYGEFPTFANTFHPRMMKLYFENQGIESMLTTTIAPSLSIMKFTYGLDNELSILSMYLLDSAIFFGNTNATASQFYDIAGLIDTEVHYMKITEIMLFFHMMKLGKFRDRNGSDRSKMYGNFNGEVIMDCLYAFRQWRNEELDRIERNKRAQRALSDERNIVRDPKPYIEKLSKTFNFR